MRRLIDSLRSGSRPDWLVGGLVLVVYALVQVWLLLGPHPYDPAKYFVTAVDFPDVPRDYWTLRLGLIAPVLVAVKVFGSSEAAYYAVPIATGLLLAAAVYSLMLMLFRERVSAAAAALVTALSPYLLLNSSFIFPDTTATATFAAAFLCLVLGGARDEEPRWARAPDLWALAAGVLLSWTYLVRELSPIMLPAVVAAFVLLRYPARRIILVGVAALVTVSVELLNGALRYGDPLARVHTLLDRRDAPIRSARLELMERIQEQVNDPLDALLVFPRLLLDWSVGWLFLVLLTVFVFGLVRFRDRRLWLLGAWVFTFWAWMAAFALWRLPTGELLVNVTNVRYWYPIFPPLVMGAFASLGLLLRDRALPGLRAVSLGSACAVVLAVLVLVPGSLEFRSCADEDVWRNEPAARWHELRAWFATPPSERYDFIWTDGGTRRLVLAFDSTRFGRPLWNGRVEGFAASRGLDAPTGDPRRKLILVHTGRFPDLQSLPEELRRDWSPVFRSGDGRLILLAHEPAPSSDSGSDWAVPVVRRRASVEPGECGLSEFGTVRVAASAPL